MMMMMIKKSFLLFLFISFAGISFSQEDDFGLWIGLTARHEILKKLDVELSGCLRTYNNSTQIEQSFLEGGVHYRFNKYISTAGSYRLISILEDDSKYHFRHKLFLDIKGSIPYRNFQFTGRLRLQRTTRTYIEDDEDLLAKYYVRLRLKAGYNFNSFPINPYFYYEMFCPAFSDTGFEISKFRLSPGIQLQISHRSSLEAEYIFQRDYNPHISNEHIISINYNINF
ncbi:MAG: DUF2490 domain-containing protein [Bacteroidia bacterium]|nr:DUF2490 domain-containing protein [Bacteroidia bacterium]